MLSLSDNQAPAANSASRGGLLVLESLLRQVPLEPILLTPGLHSLGSDPACSFVVEWQGVRPRHCEFLVEQGKVVLKAIDPRTWLNRGPVKEAVLRAGDRLTLGPLEFAVSRILELPRELETPPPPTPSGPTVEAHVETVIAVPPVATKSVDEILKEISPTPAVPLSLEEKSATVDCNEATFSAELRQHPSAEEESLEETAAKFIQEPEIVSHKGAATPASRADIADEFAFSAEATLARAQSLLDGLMAGEGTEPSVTENGAALPRLDLAESLVLERKRHLLEDLLQAVQQEAERARRQTSDAADRMLVVKREEQRLTDLAVELAAKQRQLEETEQRQKERNLQLLQETLSSRQKAGILESERAQLDAVRTEFEGQKLAFQKDRQNFELQNREAEQQRERFQAEQRELATKAAEVERESATLKERTQAIDAQFQEVTARQEAANVTDQANARLRENLEARRLELESEELRLDEERRGFERARQFFQSQRQELETERATLQETKDSLETQSRQLQEESDRILEREAATADAERQLNSGLAELELKQQEMQQSLKRLADRENEYQSEARRLAQLERELQERQDRLTVSQLENANWFEQLTAELTEVERQHAAAVDAVAALNRSTDQISQLSVELEQTRSQLTLKQLENASWYQQFTAEREELLRKQAFLEHQAEQAEAERIAQHSRTVHQLCEQEADVARRQAELHQLQHALQIQEERLQAQGEALTRDRAEFVAKAREFELHQEAVTAKLSAAQNETEADLDEIENRADELDRREQELEEQARWIVLERETLAVAQQRLDEQNLAIEQCLREIRASDDEFTQQSQRLTEQKASLATEAQKLDAARADLERRMAELEESTTEIERDRRDVHQFSNELEAERGRMARLQEEIDSERERLMQEAHSLQQQRDEFGEECRRWQQTAAQVANCDEPPLKHVDEQPPVSRLFDETELPSFNHLEASEEAVAESITPDDSNDAAVDSGEECDFLARMEANAMRARQMASGLKPADGVGSGRFSTAVSSWDRPTEQLPEPSEQNESSLPETESEEVDEEALALRSRLAAMFDIRPDAAMRSPSILGDHDDAEDELNVNSTDSDDDSNSDRIDVDGLLASLRPKNDCRPEPPRTATLAPARKVELTDIEDSVSVAAYMEQLFARSRRGGDTFEVTPVISSAPTRPEPVAPSPTPNRWKAEPSETLREAETETTDDRPDDGTPRPVPGPIFKPDRDAIRANLDSLRAVANQNARSAIAKYSNEQLRTRMLLRIVLAAGSLLAALALLIPSLMGRWEMGASGWSFVAVALVMMVELAYSSRHFLREKWTQRKSPAQLKEKPPADPSPASDPPLRNSVPNEDVPAACNAGVDPTSREITRDDAVETTAT